jgi:adenylate cyclase
MFVKIRKKYLQRSIVKKYLLVPGFLTSVLSISLWQIGIWQSSELLASNLLLQTRYHLTNDHWDERIAVIAIDDRTLAKYGEFPISRNHYTQLIETLEASPPATIGFDILFSEPTGYDTALAEAMAINGSIVLAIAPSSNKKTLLPVPILNNVTATGHIVSNADIDGITRQIPLYIQQFPSLSIKLLEIYNHSLEKTFITGNQKTNLQPIIIPSPQIATTEQTVFINWVAPINTIPTYSFIDVIERKIDTAKLKNKIVIVGLTATGAKDTLQTPFPQTPSTAGIYVHTATIDNLLNQRFLQKVPWQLEIFFLIFIAVGVSFFFLPLKLNQRTLTLILLPSTWFIISLFLLTKYNTYLPIVSPISTIIISAMTIQWQEQKEKQQLMSLFASHVSQETASLIWQKRDQILQNGQLEAQEMVASVLFSDIRSFTSISEGMTPRELLDWLNQYLGAMAECVQQHHGVVDKYIGDAVMAVFGIPFAHDKAEEIQQDAINAVAAAMDMQKRLILLNQELEKASKPTIHIGIGIHTGLVVAGSMGGSQRLNYSVLGDAVNVAARLEQLNKNTKDKNPYSILISETTFQLIKSHFPTQTIEEMQLKGRQQLTMIYSITGNQNNLVDKCR